MNTVIILALARPQDIELLEQCLNEIGNGARRLMKMEFKKPAGRESGLLFDSWLVAQPGARHPNWWRDKLRDAAPRARLLVWDGESSSSSSCKSYSETRIERDPRTGLIIQALRYDFEQDE